ncbi:hypothetical protein NL676_032058 [Syzygium grande]|nr:hypothetical protein NL676_032058 [Syzygium grande]
MTCWLSCRRFPIGQVVFVSFRRLKEVSGRQPGHCWLGVGSSPSGYTRSVTGQLLVELGWTGVRTRCYRRCAQAEVARHPCRAVTVGGD